MRGHSGKTLRGVKTTNQCAPRKTIKTQGGPEDELPQAGGKRGNLLKTTKKGFRGKKTSKE